MRIVCPTSTSQSLLGARASPSNTNQSRDTHESKKRAGTRNREQKVKLVEEARKKTEKKTKVQARKPVFSINFIYVGNLEPRIKVQQLEDLFSKFGTIIRTTIRCSRGQAVNVGMNVPTAALTARDRQYATIEFHQPLSAKKALVANGIVLDGCKLVVSISPADLPEVQDIVQTRLKIHQQRQALPVPRPRIPADSRAIQRVDTERFLDYGQPHTDRIRLFGFSFAKCIT